MVYNFGFCHHHYNYHNQQQHHNHNQGRTKGWASRAAAPGAKLLGTLRHHWNNPKYGGSQLRFPHMKEFLRI